SGQLYADGRANAVFLLSGKENQPVGAELRGTGPLRWLGLAPGSRKNLGYFSLHPPGATVIILCESAIDAISCFLLYPTSWAISTAGARPTRAGFPHSWLRVISSAAASMPTAPERIWLGR